MKILLLLLVGVALLAGCATKPSLPRQPHLSPADVIARMAQQGERTSSVTGEGSVTLTRANGQSVRLDAVMVAKFPDKVRLRAWKFGRAIFDLTLTPEGVWMLVPDMSRRQKILPAGLDAAKVMRGWSALHGDFFSEANLKIVEETNDLLVVERPAEKGTRIRAVIDRLTLSVRQHTVVDDKGRTHFTIDYDRYRLVNGIAWPMRMRAKGEQGNIEINLDDVQLNEPVAPGAFVPPARAEKLQ